MQMLIIIFVMFLTFYPLLASADDPFNERSGRSGKKAVSLLVESLLEVYAPEIKERISEVQDTVKKKTHFSGKIKNDFKPVMIKHNESEKATKKREKCLVRWSSKIAPLDLKGVKARVKIWREIRGAKLSLEGETKQKFGMNNSEFNVMLRFGFNF